MDAQPLVIAAAATISNVAADLETPMYPPLGFVVEISTERGGWTPEQPGAAFVSPSMSYAEV
jgi:hypothetical protein